MNKAKSSQYFGYHNRPITPALTANNGVHNDLYNKGMSQGVLINYASSTDTFRTVDISEIVMEKGNLNLEMSYASMKELATLGLQLAPDSFKRQDQALITSYILNSALCYVETIQRDGKRKTFFTTKNYDVIVALTSRLSPTERLSKLKSFGTQFSTSPIEINSGTFEVVSLTPDTDGLKLGKVKLNIKNKNTFMSTMYAVGVWNDSIINFLKHNKVKISYWQDDEPQQLITSLIPELVSRWLGTSNVETVKTVTEGTQDVYCLGNVILPDFSTRGEFATVPILNIRDIQPIK